MDPIPDRPPQSKPAPPERRVFANRTLNLRGVPVIGYDMDYTLIHYRVDEWEGLAFNLARDILERRGIPVEGMRFDPKAFTIGLAFDLQLGNVVKATRFGYVVRARHGNSMIAFDELRATYAQTIVDLGSPRFEFMNTMFELSRASLWTQLVARHDDHPIKGVSGYADLYRLVDEALVETHVASSLKADIVADPDRFVDADPSLVETIMDQRLAGKRLLLITNSDWAYTRTLMAYAVNPYCPPGTTWRDLFDIVIVSANKPRFFSDTNPIYRVVDEDRTLLEPHSGRLEAGAVYFGGNARLVEESLDVSGDPLYVGDHLFGDVHVSKDVLRWRTSLIVRELESEITAAIKFAPRQLELSELMDQKGELDHQQALLRLRTRRPGATSESYKALAEITANAQDLDERIAPLAREAAMIGSDIWGPLMRAGQDKSLFARQVERYADVYTSRVSNFSHETPFGYIRASRLSLPHDEATVGAG